MKILMTTDTVGGVWTYCMELCRHLSAADVEVHLVTMGARMSESQQKEAGTLGHVILYETDFLLEWMQQPWRDVEECGEWLLQMEKVIQPDIVHLNCFAYGCLPFQSPVIIVAHSDVYSWFLAVKKDDPPKEWNRYYSCVKNGLRHADLLIAPTQAMMDVVNQLYPVRTPSRVIYNGRSGKNFHSGIKTNSVFSMGRLWDEAKNIRLLMKSASEINATITVAGASRFDNNSIRIPANVKFAGRLTAQQVAEQLASASVFVLPAKYEPFGLAPLEAALSGCALVLGDIPTLREIWQDAAIYVNTEDADALAETVNELLSNSEMLAQMQSAAGLRAKLFTAEAMAGEYLDVYRQLLVQHPVTEKQEAA